MIETLKKMFGQSQSQQGGGRTRRRRHHRRRNSRGGSPDTAIAFLNC